jgi:hypothetical protein
VALQAHDPAQPWEGGHPFPVDTATCDRSIAVLRPALQRTKIDDKEKSDALHRPDRLQTEPSTPALPACAGERIRETPTGQMAVQGRLPL